MISVRARKIPRQLLLRETALDRQADIRRRPEFDAGMCAIGGRTVVLRGEGGERVADLRIVSGGIEPAEYPERRRAGFILHRVGEVGALIVQRTDAAERIGLAEAEAGDPKPRGAA